MKRIGPIQYVSRCNITLLSSESYKRIDFDLFTFPLLINSVALQSFEDFVCIFVKLDVCIFLKGPWCHLQKCQYINYIFSQVKTEDFLLIHHRPITINRYFLPASSICINLVATLQVVALDGSVLNGYVRRFFEVT